MYMHYKQKTVPSWLSFIPVIAYIYCTYLLWCYIFSVPMHLLMWNADTYLENVIKLHIFTIISCPREQTFIKFTHWMKNIFCVLILWLLAYLIKVIPKTRLVYYKWYLRFDSWYLFFMLKIFLVLIIL
jgi:hypothetical protein